MMNSFRNIIQPIQYRFHNEHAPIKTTTEFGFTVRIRQIQQVNWNTNCDPNLALIISRRPA